jgi:hypothetical protein
MADEFIGQQYQERAVELGYEVLEGWYAANPLVQGFSALNDVLEFQDIADEENLDDAMKKAAPVAVEKIVSELFSRLTGSKRFGAFMGMTERAFAEEAVGAYSSMVESDASP